MYYTNTYVCVHMRETLSAAAFKLKNIQNTK